MFGENLGWVSMIFLLSTIFTVAAASSCEQQLSALAEKVDLLLQQQSKHQQLLQILFSQVGRFCFHFQNFCL